MPQVSVNLSCSVADSFRVRQVCGFFDLSLPATATQRFSVTLPAVDEPWKIGLITGPSGSGKTGVARAAFPGAASLPAWPPDRAIVDCLHGDIRQVTRVLTAVGFASAPAWLRPYRSLSGGEQFRADLARQLLSPADAAAPAVMDEFASTVDRTAARIGAAAVAAAIRNGAVQRRFVAVTCHHDVAQWLCPDWCLDMATGSLQRFYPFPANSAPAPGPDPSNSPESGKLAIGPSSAADPDLQRHQPRRTRGLLCRPEIRIAVYRCSPGHWAMFKRHHYLSASLPAAVRCYLGCLSSPDLIAGSDLSAVPVAFAAIAPVAGFGGYWRFSRVVVLPDYQGIGIGAAFRDTVAGMEAPGCRRLSLVTSHPGMIRSLHVSRNWAAVSTVLSQPRKSRRGSPPAGQRRVCSFVWIGSQCRN